MNYDEYGWRTFLTEARNPTPNPRMYTERRLLREVNEEEIEHIRAAIDEMGAEDLAFNELFQGKTRLVLDFPTMDTSSDLGKFVDNFREMGYDIDWEKGLISGERELKDGSIAASVASLMGHEPSQSKKRKVQMKIGKFWAKIYELTSKREELAQKVSDSINPTDRGLGSRRTDTIASSRFTGNQIEAALDEPEQKRYQQLADQLEMYLGFIVNPLGRVKGSEDAKKNQEYWQQNADYIKKNIGNLSVNKYSIIVSRDPIDILRMSDHDRITSCHSPPSRSGNTGDSYYRCVVAEAHGHGAIAYAVETSELLSATNTSNLDSAEQEINNGEEIFADSARGSDVGISDEMVPVARLRLRQVRASDFDNGIDHPRVATIEVAVPENRVYGLKIPGFRDRVFNWAKEAQTTHIADIPEDATWIKYGGSYEDNGIRGLLRDLTGREIERVGQNTETEDSLPDQLGGLEAQMAAEAESVENMADEWNYRYQACQVMGTVTDDGGEGFYIDIEAEMTITWDVDEWESLPPGDAAEHWCSELNDMSLMWADGTAWSTRVYRDGDHIRMGIVINVDGVDGFEDQSFAYNSENFEDFCVELNRIDDVYDGVKESITRMAKRDGYMAGGALNEWGIEIRDGDFDSYEWDTTAEEGYEYDEIEGITADHTAYPVYPEGMSIEDARMILESRDFTIPLRKALVEKAWAGTEASEDDRQYPAFRVHTEELRTTDDTNIQLVLTFYANSSSSDAQVKSMRWTVDEWEDEEVLDAAIQAVFNQIVGGGLTGRGDMDVPPAKGTNQEVTNESIVKNWKNFLNS